jgi:predicted Rossmann fold flavoprotein
VRLGDGVFIEADAVVLATGGVSYPRTGSTGDGYGMAKAAGHTVGSPLPGLVPLVLQERSVSELQGVSLQDVEATLSRGRALVARRRGELLFTHFGVSGPVIISLSLMASQALQEGPLLLTLDLAPDLDSCLFEEQLRSAASSRPRSRCLGFLRGYLPQALANHMLAQCTITQERELGQLTGRERQGLYDLIKHMRLTVLRTRPIAEAMVTIGGVCTQEIDPRTMASRVVQGLYLAGEIIDVAGDTGGYNLQIAFTTGYVAGESAARALSRNKV